MIKIIAILTMLIDHVGQVFFPSWDIFSLIGRLAFPLFAWGIANGYMKTRNFKTMPCVCFYWLSFPSILIIYSLRTSLPMFALLFYLD